VAPGPVDTGNLPGNNGYKLQGMALELRNAAQIGLNHRMYQSSVLFSILKN
jgi:hypothetical protein